MRRRHGQRARLGGVLLAALGALALLALPSVAAAKDRNHDRIPDRWEKRHHLSLKVKQTTRDQDRDHLRNRAEFLSGNDPRDRDSDDDGVMDDDENAGTDRLVRPRHRTARHRPVRRRHRSRASSPATPGSSATRMRTTTRRPPPPTRARTTRARATTRGPAATTPGRTTRPTSPTTTRAISPARTRRARTTRADDDDANCTTADLVEGAVVEEAELELANGVATFEEVELAG